MFKSLSRKPIVEEAIEILKEQIEGMQSGDKLPTEIQLVKDMGVSRQTIREVLVTLQAEGFIQIKRGKGAFVIDKDEFNRNKFIEWFNNNKFKIKELIEIRLALEPFAAKLAANRINKEEIKRLEELHEELLYALKTKNGENIVTADESFHETIMEASKNEGLRFIYNNFIPSLHEYRSKALSPPANPNLVKDAHMNILNALKSNDGLKAYDAMMQHILDSQDDVMNTVLYISESNNKTDN